MEKISENQVGVLSPGLREKFDKFIKPTWDEQNADLYPTEESKDQFWEDLLEDLWAFVVSHTWTIRILSIDFSEYPNFINSLTLNEALEIKFLIQEWLNRQRDEVLDQVDTILRIKS